MPLELKTGKQSTSAEHRGQVILYTMLMTAVADNSINDEVKEGILLYLKYENKFSFYNNLQFFII